MVLKFTSVVDVKSPAALSDFSFFTTTSTCVIHTLFLENSICRPKRRCFLTSQNENDSNMASISRTVGFSGGRALRVAKPKRHETLENTWKAITEGRAMPLSRHMKKWDTWESHGRGIIVESLEPSQSQSQVNKSETFKDRTNEITSSPGATTSRLRKEPSLSQEDLNRRVEAFIKKFNEEMRLQRQESLNRYAEMINRGS